MRLHFESHIGQTFRTWFHWRVCSALTSGPQNKLRCAQTGPDDLLWKWERKKHQWHEEVFNKVVKLWLKCVIDFRQTIGHRDACENSQKRFLSLVKIPSIQWKHVVMPSLHTQFFALLHSPKQVFALLVGKTILENHSTTSVFVSLSKISRDVHELILTPMLYIKNDMDNLKFKSWIAWSHAFTRVRSTTSFMSMVYAVYFWYPPSWSSIKSTINESRLFKTD